MNRLLIALLLVAAVGCQEAETGTLVIVNHSIQLSNNIFRVDAAPCGVGAVGLGEHRYNLLDAGGPVIALGASRDFLIAPGCYDVTLHAGFFAPVYKGIVIEVDEETIVNARF